MEASELDGDQLLEQQEGYSTASSRDFSGLPGDYFNTVKLYLELIYGVGVFDKRKKVPVEKILENAKVVFDDDALKSKDSLWMNKLASTLQELVDGSFTANWPLVVKCLPTDPREYKEIQNIKEFLNFVKHFKDSQAVSRIPLLLGESYDGATEVTDEIFEKICAKFITALAELFKKHCQK